jgi:hypothetical protein
VDGDFIAEHFSSSTEYQRFVEEYQSEIEGLDVYTWD